MYKKIDMNRVRQQAAGMQALVLDVDGVLTDGQLPFDAEGAECKTFHVRDGYGMRRVLEAGIEIIVISGRECPAVRARMDELGIRHVHLGVDDKLKVLRRTLDGLGIDGAAVTCVGDDVPDLACMEFAGLAVAVADAHPALDPVADWHTQRGGGRGAVREVCDLLLDART